MTLLTTLKGLINNTRNTIANVIAPKTETKGLTKSEVFVLMIKKHPVITVVLNPTVQGVILPKHLMDRETVQLQYGMNLVRPIPDLNVGSDGISATLSFNRKDFKTFIPWDAVMFIIPGNPGPVGPSGGSPNLVVIKGGKYNDDVDNEQKVYAEAA